MSRTKGHLNKTDHRRLQMIIRAVTTRGLVKDEEAAFRLKRTFEVALRGLNVTFRSPLLKHLTLPNLRDKFWDYIAHHLGSGLLPEHRIHLVDYEEGERDRFGDLSSFLPWSVDGPDKVLELKSPRDLSLTPKSLDSRRYGNVIELMRGMVPANSLKRVSPINAVRGIGHTTIVRPMDYTTHSGFPYCKSGWFGVDGLEYEIGQHSINEAKRLHYSFGNNELVAFWFIVMIRIQSKSDDKFMKRKRIVNAGEKREAVYGRTYTIEAIKAMTNVHRNGVSVYPGWRDPSYVDLTMQVLMMNAYKHNNKILSTDISGFDKSILPGVAVQSTGIFDTWFQGCTRHVHNFIKSIMYKWGVVSPSQIIDPCAGGMPSGTSKTNMVDSNSQSSMILYGDEMEMYRLLGFCVNGDDQVGEGEGYDPSTFSKLAALFNWEASEDKQLYAKDMLFFLQRLHTMGRLGGIASHMRTINRAAGYERMRFREWNGYTDVIRWISLLENLALSPGYEETVEFIKTHDKLNLGAGMTVDELIAKAGNKTAKALLNPRMTWQTAMDKYSFDHTATRGVLRGETLPPMGSIERFFRIYGLRAVFSYYKLPPIARDMISEMFNFSHIGLTPEFWNSKEYPWRFSKLVIDEYQRVTGIPVNHDPLVPLKEKELHQLAIETVKYCLTKVEFIEI